MGCNDGLTRMRVARSIVWIRVLLPLCLPIFSLDASGNPRVDGSICVIRVEDGRLTVKLRDIPLEKVLMEIAGQTGIQIVFYGPMETSLTADFSRFPMDKGMKRFTPGCDHVLIYGQGKERCSEPEIKKVMVYSKMAERSSKRLEPRVIEPKAWEARKSRLNSLINALEHKDPEVREEAVDVLAELKDDRSFTHLTEILLNDKDEDLRESAIDALAEIGGKEVISPLMNALRDEDEDVREAAAETLRGITGRDVSR